MPILAKINYDLIDQSRLFSGKKGRYLDIALIDTPNDKYGNDFMVVQSVSKEDREAGKKGPILGNGKYPAKRDGAVQPAAPAPKYDTHYASGTHTAAPPAPKPPAPKQAELPDGEDVPF